MTYPEDPRERSWDDGTANPPPDRPEADQPTETWQAYPDSQPLPDSAAYPDQPTQQYPSGQYGQPQYNQPNPTQAMPPYDPNQHYAANQHYAGQNYGQPPIYTGETAYISEDPGSGGNSSRKWLLALVALVALAVVVLAGFLVLSNQKSEPATAAGPSSTSRVPLPTLPPSQAPSVSPSVPGGLVPEGLVPGGIPEILGESGAAIGTITAIDGSTLSIQGIDGAPVTVLVTPQTQVLSLSGFDVSSLTVGSLVVVNGSPMQDGTITADVIVETPDLGG